MTKDKKNRKIAEWLEPRPAWDRNCRGRSPVGAWNRRRLREYRDGKVRGYWDDQPSDFFTDEAASALLLDRIIESDRRYGCPYVSHPLMTSIVSMREDRKTAICECALRLISTPHASGHTR